MQIVIRILYASALLLYILSFAGYIRAFRQNLSQPHTSARKIAGCALLLQLAGLVTYVAVLRQAPFLGMFQGFTFAALILALIFLLVSRKLNSDTALGLLTFFLVSLFSLVGLFTPLTQVQDPLLLKAGLSFIIHASIALFSYGAFAIAFICSILYLVLHRELKSKKLGTFFERLPSLDELDHLIYFSVGVGFLSLTVAIISGMAWTSIRLGSLLQLDLKEIITLVNWLVFALYLHSRRFAGWRGRLAAWMVIGGFSIVIFNFLIVTLLLSKTHSYL